MFARHYHQRSLLVDLKGFFLQIIQNYFTPSFKPIEKGLIIGLISTPHEQTWVQTQSHLNDLGL